MLACHSESALADEESLLLRPQRANLKIGILAVQGDYEAHARMLARLGADYVLVRTPEDASQVDAMILPGGESTTMLKFLKEEGLEAALRALDARGASFFGTCAGAILLARDVRSPAQESLGFADLAITRNAYGRQLASEDDGHNQAQEHQEFSFHHNP